MLLRVEIGMSVVLYIVQSTEEAGNKKVLMQTRKCLVFGPMNTEIYLAMIVMYCWKVISFVHW